MAKNDLLKRNDQRPVVAKGELVPVATVVQIDRLTVAGPYSGDFQIKNGGRLIVGEDPDSGARIIVGSYGQFGYSSNGTQTFSLYNATVGTHTPGDLHLGNLAQNYLLYQQTTGTLGLYTPQGAGFIARRDGTLQAGHADGAHMLWNASEEALQVRFADDVKINLGADGNASFDGTIYAAGGRIYGTLAVDDVLRAGDVDGPAVYLGRFERDTGTETIRTAEIIATDDKNLPWFHVVAGGETLPGYFHLGGTGDYDQHLSYDGTTLALDGTIRAQAGEIVSMDVSGQLTVSGKVIFGGGRGRLDATGLKLETSQSGDEGYNVVKWVQDLSVSPLIDVFSIFTEQALGQTIVTLGGPTAGTTPSPGVSASTIKLQPIADSGGDAHIYLQPKVGSTVSPELKVSSALGVTINATTTKIGDGGSTNYAQFDSTGHLTFTGTAKPWNDMIIEPVARTTGANAPTFEKWFDDVAGSSRGVYLYSFDDAAASSEKEVFFNLQMSHGWDGGSIQFHVHWVGAVTDADAGSTPRWGLEYAWKEPGGTYGDTTVIYATGNHLSESVVANKHYITQFAAIAPGSTADDLSSVMIGRLFRDSANAADTYNATGAKCGLLYIDAHYQIARIGSTDEYTA